MHGTTIVYVNMNGWLYKKKNTAVIESSGWGLNEPSGWRYPVYMDVPGHKHLVEVKWRRIFAYFHCCYRVLITDESCGLWMLYYIGGCIWYFRGSQSVPHLWLIIWIVYFIYLRISACVHRHKKNWIF